MKLSIATNGPSVDGLPDGPVAAAASIDADEARKLAGQVGAIPGGTLANLG
jgi:hypothetical protein